ncbi:transposase [Microbacterium sp. IO18]|uniref:transposase n=1 Tax=Microbacterium sp. IO18 TaxID=3390997 RepID=UPI00244452CD|nr:transposase [Microbacterium sp. 3H14]
MRLAAWSTQGLHQPYSEFAAGEPCRACRRPLLNDLSPADRDAGNSTFRSEHGHCKLGFWAVEGCTTQHCHRCCPPPPLSPSQVRIVRRLLSAPAARRVHWRLELTCGHITSRDTANEYVAPATATCTACSSTRGVIRAVHDPEPAPPDADPGLPDAEVRIADSYQPLTDAQWGLVAQLVHPASGRRRGRPRRDARRVVNAIRYRAQAGIAWRELPREFGAWQTAARWHRELVLDGRWDKIRSVLAANTGKPRMSQDGNSGRTIAVPQAGDSTSVDLPSVVAVRQFTASIVQTSQRVYAISDIHGHLAPLLAALDLVDLDGDPGAELILLGDYVDRGTSSCQVLATIRSLQARHPRRVTALLGNHDDWLLGWLDGADDNLQWLLNDKNLITVKSFLTPLELAHALGHNDPDSDASALDGPTMNRNLKHAILSRHRELIAWLRELPRVHETDEHIFVHAGIDEDAGEHWRTATPKTMLTEKFPATTGPFMKTIVAGHVRTQTLHSDGSNTVFHDGESHWYIDGAVESTGRLNLLRYNVADGTYDECSLA